MSRIAAILQLCLVFTLLCWVGSYPFMGSMMAHKKQAFLFQSIMGSGDLITRTYADDSSGLEKLERNNERFLKLPDSLRFMLGDAYNALKNSKSETTFFSKLQKSISSIVLELPPFDRAWIFFGIIVSIMLLLRSAGAPYAALLLPIIVVAAALDNQWNGKEAGLSSEAKLFPSEEYIITHYMAEPLDNHIFKQQEQLKNGWQRYLISEWVQEMPSDDPLIFKAQVELGEYQFNLERLLRSLEDGASTGFFHRKEAPSLWIVYFLWNCCFAWMAWRSVPNPRRVLLH